MAAGVYATVYIFDRTRLYVRDIIMEIPASTAHYGIWLVDEFAVDGTVQPPLITNEQRWWRVIFDYPGGTTIQYVGGHERRFLTMGENGRKVYHLTDFEDERSMGLLTVDEPLPEHLTLEGELDGRRVRATLHRTPMSFYLTNQRMRFIHDTIANR